MKTRTKKCGVFAALAAVLLLTAALVISCPESLGPGGLTVPKAAERQLFEPPPGMGLILLDIDVEKFKERTTLPTTTTYDALNKFSKVEVYVSGGDNGPYGETNWDRSSPIAVNIHGTPYTVTVVGYNNATPAVAVALGSDSATVSAATGATVDITMKEITTSGAGTYGGNGTLALDLTNTVGATTVTATITGLTSGATPNATGNALTTTSYLLLPGYYSLELSLAKSGYKAIVYRDIVLIWSGLTSTYSRTLAMVSNLHEITYTFNDARVPVAGDPPLTTTKNFTHADTFTNPGATPTPPQYLDSSNTHDTSFAFDGWYTGAPATPGTAPTGALFAIGTKVIKPQTLYAKWAAVPPANAQIEIYPIDVDFSAPANKLTAAGIILSTSGTPIGPGPYEYDQSDMPTITFAVAPAVISSLEATPDPVYTWYDDVTTLATGITATSVNVDFSDDAYTSTGDYVFYLHIQEGDNWYSAEITVHINLD